MEPEPPVHQLARRADARRSWPRPTPRRPASSGPSRSASSTPCSRWPSPRSSPPAAPTRRRSATRSPALSVDTIVGTRRLDVGRDPVPNVAKTKLVGGQWRTGRHADRLRPRHRRQHRQARGPDRPATRRADRGVSAVARVPSRSSRSIGSAKRFGALAVIDDLELRARRRARRSASSARTVPARRRCSNLVAGDLRPTRARCVSTARDVTRLPAHRRCRPGIGRTHRCRGRSRG